MKVRGLLLGSAVLLTSTAALAEEWASSPEPVPGDAKASCVGALEQAQSHEKAGRYLASQEELLKCINPVCGDAILSWCTRMHGELQSAIPSVVFSANDEARNVDLGDVAVTLDGKPLLAVLDGKATALDPGRYSLTFNAAGHEPVEKVVVIRAGEKFRQIHVSFSRADGVTAPLVARVAAPQPTRALEPSGRSMPVMSYVLGGLGVVGLGTFATLRVMADALDEELQQACAPVCRESAVESVDQKYLMSNVALGVGAAALGGAVLFYVLEPSEPTSLEVALQIVPTRQGAMGGARGRF
jgi:hypothetical protein